MNISVCCLFSANALLDLSRLVVDLLLYTAHDMIRGPDRTVLIIDIDYYLSKLNQYRFSSQCIFTCEYTCVHKA